MLYQTLTLIGPKVKNCDHLVLTCNNKTNPTKYEYLLELHCSQKFKLSECCEVIMCCMVVWQAWIAWL